MGLSVDEKKILIRGARCAVSDFLEKGATNDASALIPGLPSALLQARSVFVTIYSEGMLRGSMGMITALLPLWQAVRVCARNAAYKDPRFLPLAPDELPHVSFEIALMDEPRPFVDFGQISSGNCGIMLQKGFRREVFMPGSLKQAPGDREGIMRYLRDKVAIDDEGADVPEEWSVFDAEVFIEDNL